MEPEAISPSAGEPGEQEYMVVARRDEVPPGTLKRVAYGEEPVVLANIGGQFYALEDSCMHYGIPLSDGFVREGTIICMWHAWRYDIASGRLVNPPSTRLCLASYPVRLDGDSVLIGPRAAEPPPA